MNPILTRTRTLTYLFGYKKTVHSYIIVGVELVSIFYHGDFKPIYTVNFAISLFKSTTLFLISWDVAFALSQLLETSLAESDS